MLFRDGMRKDMKHKFFSHEDFTFEHINRSSRACGPLAKWAIAQVGLCSTTCVLVCVLCIILGSLFHVSASLFHVLTVALTCELLNYSVTFI